MLMHKNTVKCPHCGESYYEELYSTSTCIYYQPIYKDGVNINPDRNVTTTYCSCLNCNEKFSYKNRQNHNFIDKSSASSAYNNAVDSVTFG